MAQEKKYDVFISYSRKESAIASEICKAFDQVGFTYFIDIKGLGGVTNYVTKLADELDNSKVMLLLASANSYRSKYVPIGLHYAFNHDITILPYALDDTTPPKDFEILLIHTNWHYLNIDPIIPDLLTSVSELIDKDITDKIALVENRQNDPADIEQAKREALPEGAFQVGDLMYQASENGNGLTVCGLVNKAATEIRIPTQIKYGTYTYEVASIGDEAFAWCEGLTSISIPNSVTSIGEEAFVGCSSLTSITIPNSVTTILEGAFEGCSSLTSITIPNSVTSIGKGAFEGCYDLTSITIPNSVTSIGNRAFEGCYDLTSITIPNSVTSIGMDAFYGCESLTSIVVEKGNITYDSRENCNAIIETATNTLIQGCKNTLIPNSVTSIGDYAFFTCSSLTSITIPNSVTSIGKKAFSHCRALTSITIPNSVTSIGEEAFSYCLSLTSITIPNSVTSIGNGAFSHCSSLASIIIPNSVTSIGERAFDGCSSLKSIKIPRTVTYIGKGAFPEHTQVIRE